MAGRFFTTLPQVDPLSTMPIVKGGHLDSKEVAAAIVSPFGKHLLRWRSGRGSRLKQPGALL